MSGERRRRRRGWRGGQTPRPERRHDLKLVEYLDDLAETRAEARENLAVAGERALKILDGFLADLARSYGMEHEKAGLGDSIQYLARLPDLPGEIAGQAERFRDTRNALFHNADIMLRPEAAQRVIDGVEGIVRMAAEGARDMARSKLATAGADEPAADARDRMLDLGYNQLIVVDDRGGVVDLLTERDIVVLEAEGDLNGSALTAGDAVGRRDHLAAALLSVHGAAQEAIDALRDERVAAVVLTENGKQGERPLGIITRGDVLKGL